MNILQVQVDRFAALALHCFSELLFLEQNPADKVIIPRMYDKDWYSLPNNMSCDTPLVLTTALLSALRDGASAMTAVMKRICPYDKAIRGEILLRARERVQLINWIPRGQSFK